MLLKCGLMENQLKVSNKNYKLAKQLANQRKIRIIDCQEETLQQNTSAAYGKIDIGRISY